MKRIYDFLRDEIWIIPAKKMDKSKLFLLNQLRTILLAMRGFSEDQCLLRASALTFYTLLSIVPVFAMAFGIAKGFGMERLLEKQLSQYLHGHEEVLNKVLEYSKNLLDSANGGVIAGVGVLMLLWTIIKLLTNIENSFNEIWGVKVGRSIGRKFSDYLSLILICPILLGIASSATLIIATYLERITTYFEFYGIVLFLVNFSIKSLPYLITWLLFSFLYMFLPNTTVKLKPAIFAGFVAGVLYQLLQYAYVSGQFTLSKWNAIYGSLAALPFFLVWVQISWFIVLFGAELAFAAQNVETYEFEPDCNKINLGFKFSVMLLVLSRILKHFENDQPAPDDKQLSSELDIPIRLVREILYECQRVGLISEIRTGESKNKKIGYQPAHSPEKYTVGFVVQEILNRGQDNIRNLDNSILERSRKLIDDCFFKPVVKNTNLHLRDIST